MLNSESLLNNKYYLDMDEYVYKMNLKVLRKKDKDIE
jgi:hypothetical protein